MGGRACVKGAFYPLVLSPLLGVGVAFDVLAVIFLITGAVSSKNPIDGPRSHPRMYSCFVGLHRNQIKGVVFNHCSQHLYPTC